MGLSHSVFGLEKRVKKKMDTVPCDNSHDDAKNFGKT